MELTAGKFRTRDLAYIGAMAALMAVCSWISIPTTIPFTLQTLAVFLAVGLLGGKRGTLAILGYLLLGLAGAPVFSGFGGGPACLASAIALLFRFQKALPASLNCSERAMYFSYSRG